MGRVLVVDDHDLLRQGLGRALRNNGHEVHEASNGTRAIELLYQHQYDAVLTDLRMGGADGMDVLRTTRSIQPSTAVILMTAFGSIHTAVEAFKIGALDFIQKPFEIEEVEHKVEAAIEHARIAGHVDDLRRENEERFSFDRLIGSSSTIESQVELVKILAKTDKTVLVTGEAGTGKKLIAGFLHHHSRRSRHRCLSINCAAFSSQRLEIELFGRDDESHRAYLGRLEQAREGTVILDEVATLSPAIQERLLRFLETGDVVRVGGSRPHPGNVRLVVTSEQDLRLLAKTGRMREDLVRYLAPDVIELPPLRDRKGDIPELTSVFLRRSARELKKSVRDIGDKALVRLTRHDWPGNIRELENTIERAVLVAEGSVIRPTDIQLGTRSRKRPQALGHANAGEVKPPITVDTPIAARRNHSADWWIPQAGGAPKAAQQPSVGVDGVTPRLLMVHAEDQFQKDLLALLSDRSWSVATATDLPGAVSSAVTQRATIVAIDPSLPSLATSDLRHFRKLGIPLIALTPREDRELIRKVADAEFVDYIVEPIEVELAAGRLALAARDVDKAQVELPAELPGPATRFRDLGQWLWLGPSLAPTIRGAAHDVLNHLAAIRGFLDSPRDGAVADEERDTVAAALREVERCSVMLRDLGGLMRPFSESAQSPFWINGFALTLALEDMFLSAPFQSIRIATTGVDHRFRIPRVLLWHLLSPQVNNAREALRDAHDGAVKITVAPDPVEAILSLTVDDNGPGWGSLRDRLQKSLLRGDSLSTKGTNRGGGLQNLGRLVRGLGGQVRLRTSPAGGSQVNVLLPWRFRG